MAVKNIFHPIVATMLFITGIWMGSMINPLFGLLTILGGLLLGSSSFFQNGVAMNKKTKVLFIATFIFLLSLMSGTYVVITALYL